MLMHLDNQFVELELLKYQLAGEGVRIHSFLTPADALRVLDRGVDDIQMLICDWYLDTAADETIRDVLIDHALRQGQPVVVYTAAADLAQSRVPAGVDVISKESPDDLQQWVRSHLRQEVL